MVEKTQPIWFSVFKANPSRLDAHCAEALGVSRADIKRLIETSDVLLNNFPCKPSVRVKTGDEVSIALVAHSTTPQVSRAQRIGDQIIANEWAISIVHDDHDVMVINKPFGLLVHEASNNAGHNVVGMLIDAGVPLAMGQQHRPGIVHRLDQFTEGLMIIAKTQAAVDGVHHQFKCRQVTKHYYAVLKGVPASLEGVIDRPIGRDASIRARKSCHHFIEGTQKDAITLYKVRHQWSNGCFVDVDIKTGRTHQIRVHFASLNCPVLGDSLYSNQPKKSVGYLLQSYYLSFSHPTTNEPLEFKLPVSDRLKKYAGQTNDGKDTNQHR